MNATEELPRGQQLLLQRLMASHCMSGREANQVFDSLVRGDYQDDGNAEDQVETAFMGQGIDSVKAAFASINKQLRPGFGLEIITMVDTSRAGGDPKYYHSVVNTTLDDVAKNEGIFSKSWNPHERAFVRLVMSALVNQYNSEESEDEEDDDDEEEGKERVKKPVETGIRRADLINLRSELEGGFKLSMDQAKRVLEILLEEKWLRTTLSTAKNRRDSVQGSIELAPRSYMELYHYITGLGMAPDKLPQFLYHRD